MTNDDGSADEELRRRLDAFVGQTGSPPRQAADLVNAPMIRHWCQAMGDANPAYLDAEWAARSRHGGIVAPPTMLQVWTHHDRRFDQAELTDDDGEERLARFLRDAGYPSVVATGAEQEYVRYLRIGDRLVYRSVIDSISERKTTALGRGFFIVTLVTYLAEGSDGEPDEVVGRMRFTTFRFRPAAADRQVT
jgi:acyl dehydratase